MTAFYKISIFASLSAHPSLFENFRFQSIGFLIVFAALALLALILSAMGWFFKRSGAGTPATGAGLTFTKSWESTQEDPHELVAVITAAVYATIEESHRIVSIHPVVDGKVMGELYLQAWSVEGRRQHFASHKVRS